VHPTSTTVPGVTDTAGADQSAQALAYGLVLAWSNREPHRLAEVALFPPFERRRFGRGGDDLREHVGCAPHRPGEKWAWEGLDACLADDSISRDQLVGEASAVGLEIEKVGRCLTLVNGEPVDFASLKPGDTVMFYGAALFVCVCRPWMIVARHIAGPFHPFGGPNRFGFVGESPAAWKLSEEIAVAAASDDHVLILGESGTGKELVAKAIHASSRRADGPFISYNGAALNEGVAPLELFGQVKGNVNAGTEAQVGLVTQAHCGTLFLDEVGSMPRKAQDALLRVLQVGEYNVLGGRLTKVDMRVIAATSRALSEFSGDFQNRFIRVVYIPPLRERPEDIPLIICHIFRTRAQNDPEVRRFMQQGPDGQMHPRLSGRLVDYLVRHPLPGNVRQLDKILMQAVAESTGDVVRLPPSHNKATPVTVPPTGPASVPPVTFAAVPASAKATRGGPPTREELVAVLEEEGYNVAAVARRYGVTRVTVYRWMDALGIKRKDETLP
jgi:DNA-binding NtrC family response regulator